MAILYLSLRHLGAIIPICFWSFLLSLPYVCGLDYKEKIT
jgi:hypothetical protein